MSKIAYDGTENGHGPPGGAAMPHDAIHVTVTTAIPMDDALRGRARDAIAPLVGGPFEMDERVDPGILGGVVVSWPGGYRDASVRAQLRRIRRTLAP